jgi:hypothetical protein
MMMAIPGLGLSYGQSSEFLDVHPELTPDPDRPGASTWQKPGFDPAKYGKVMFEPLSIFIAPDSEYKGMTADDLTALSSGFRDTVVRVLEPEIPVVDAAGSDVLHVRGALTGVKLKKQKRGLLRYTPIGIVVTAAQDAAGKRISLEDATLELDRRPRAGATGKEEPSWKSIEETFRFYATRFKSRMLAARERPGSTGQTP